MRQYLDLMERALDHGAETMDRTGTGTRSVFGHQMRFDLSGGLSVAHHQEAPYPIDHRRIAVVPARRHQCPLAAGTQGKHLGRMGRREPAISARSTASNGATGRPPTAAISTRSPIARSDPQQSRFAPPDRLGMEPRRAPRDGAGAVPLPVPDAMSPTAGSACSSTSARPISSSACPSTSRAMRC